MALRVSGLWPQTEPMQAATSTLAMTLVTQPVGSNLGPHPRPRRVPPGNTSPCAREPAVGGPAVRPGETPGGWRLPTKGLP